MLPWPPRSTLTYTLFPYTTLYRSTNKRHRRWTKRHAPSIPASLHGRSRSGGLSESMNQRAASAPYWSRMASGSTTFFFDFDILMTRPTSTGAPSASSFAPSEVHVTSSGVQSGQGSPPPYPPAWVPCVTMHFAHRRGQASLTSTHQNHYT